MKKVFTALFFGMAMFLTSCSEDGASVASSGGARASRNVIRYDYTSKENFEASVLEHSALEKIPSFEARKAVDATWGALIQDNLKECLAMECLEPRAKEAKMLRLMEQNMSKRDVRDLVSQYRRGTSANVKYKASSLEELYLFLKAQAMIEGIAGYEDKIQKYSDKIALEHSKEIAKAYNRGKKSGESAMLRIMLRDIDNRALGYVFERNEIW